MAEEGATQQRAAKYRTDGTCLICLNRGRRQTFYAPPRALSPSTVPALQPQAGTVLFGHARRCSKLIVAARITSAWIAPTLTRGRITLSVVLRGQGMAATTGYIRLPSEAGDVPPQKTEAAWSRWQTPQRHLLHRAGPPSRTIDPNQRSGFGKAQSARDASYEASLKLLRLEAASPLPPAASIFG